MFRKRSLWVGAVVALVLAGGMVAYYQYVYLPRQEPEETLMTAHVAHGDLIISVSGTGVLCPGRERELGFQTESGEVLAGYLDEVLVEVGDRVKEGDVLARLEDEDLQFAVAKAYIDLRAAQIDLAEVTEAATQAELADAETTLQNARLALTVAHLNYQNAQRSSTEADVRNTQIALRYHAQQTQELEAEGAGEDALAEAWAARQRAEAAFNEALHEAEIEDLEAWNQVDQAQNNVAQAEERLESLQSGPHEKAVLQAQLKVDRAGLALERARENLEAAELRAPFDGTVVDVAGMRGQRVGTGAIITLADLEEPGIQFWVEQSDISGVAVGNRVEIEFEGLPGQLFNGEVIRIEPALVTVENTLAVQAWASLDLSEQPADLLGDMNADVEVISAEAHDVVLVPVQALREIADGQYAVFVVEADGELAMRPVEVGLHDAVSAEIVSGLEAGQGTSPMPVVSLGQSSASSAASEGEDPQMPGPGQMIPGGGMFGGGGPGGGGRP
ncbi:MAG: efflux RND transporter periplasmic adaptor subunit [Chloroflexota bacterium]